MENEYVNTEEAVLGCLLLKPELFEKVVVDKIHFLDTKNQKVFEIMKMQYHDFKTISITGIGDNYKQFFSNKQSLNDFVTYLSMLMCVDCIPTNFDYYQETLLKNYTDQELLTEILKFQKNQISQDELLESIHCIEQEKQIVKNNTLTSNEIYKLISQKNKRIHFHFEKLYKYSNIQEHDLVIIAARPGIGKTGFALNLLENLSNAYNCVLFNMEMTEQQVYRRLVAINTRVPMSYHDNPETAYQEEQIIKGCDEISKKKIKVLTGGQTIRTIRNTIVKEASKEHTIFFIDYIGLVRDTVRNRSSYERVTEIIKELRQISMDHNCTIFCLAQINRNSEKEKDKRPKISDLKESGELEQSATTVLMLHNEDYYKGATKSVEDIDVIIGKNRNGETGSIGFKYNQKNQKFEEKRSY